MAYLGIDASLEGTGLCLLSNDGVVLSTRTVDPRGQRGAARLLLIRQATEAHLVLGIRFVMIEGYAFDAVNRAFALGEVGGVLRLLVHERGVRYEEVPPSSLKKFATGSPAADKDAMLAAAREQGARVADDNQADAYFLACVARAFDAGKYGPGDASQPTRSQLEVIHRLKNPTKRKARPRPRRLVDNPM